MSVLTAYYRMKKLPTCESKLRMDCVASTGNYETFEALAQRCRDKRFKFFYGDTPESFKAEAKRKGGMAITDTRNISTVYTPDLDSPLYGYGDARGTNDALLFLFADDYRSVEVFVAIGQKNHRTGLFNRFLDGELDDEIEALRKQAQPTNAPQA